MPIFVFVHAPPRSSWRSSNNAFRERHRRSDIGPLSFIILQRVFRSFRCRLCAFGKRTAQTAGMPNLTSVG